VTEPLARVEVEWAGDALRVVVRGEIDLSNADELERELGAAVDRASAVTVDLCEVSYLDSRGVRLLHQLAHDAGPETPFGVVAPEGTFAGSVLRLTRFPGLAVEE
jgi:anti-anti-sigma factor